jgi:sugar phosphate isomerase/epimerase
MMTPSIWTQVAAYIGCKDVSEALPALRQLGWGHFELSTEHLQLIEDAPDRQARIEQVRAQVAELGVTLSQAHAELAVNVAHPDENVREAHMDRLLCNLRTCAAMGVKVVVIHPGCGAGYTTREEHRGVVQWNRRQFGRLGDLAGELGLRVALENMADSLTTTGRRCFGATPGELLGLLERLDHPALGVCLDTSHAHLQRLDVPACIRQLAGHLIATHISDNDGSGDQHRTPGHGSIDWAGVMAAFADAGYEGLFNLEIPGENHPWADLVRIKIRHAREVAQWLVAPGA